MKTKLFFIAFLICLFAFKGQVFGQMIGEVPVYFNTLEDEDKVFSPKDFSKSGFGTLVVKKNNTNGILFFDANNNDVVDSGEEIRLTKVIDFDNVNLLKFRPNENENGDEYSSFEFYLPIPTKSKIIDPTYEYRSAIISVTPVNDAPSFDIGIQKIDVVEGTGEHEFENFAVNISAGPENEQNQKLYFRLRPSRIGGPTIINLINEIEVDEKGVLRFTLIPHASGTAHFEIYLQDNGGTDDGGGEDISDTKYFEIDVNVNKEPTSSNSKITGYENHDIVFNEEQFPYDDYENNDFKELLILEKPNGGTMWLDFNNDGIVNRVERIIKDNTIIPTEQISNLKFKPTINLNGSPYTKFSFKVSDGIYYSIDEYYMEIELLPVNSKPFFTVGSSQIVFAGGLEQTVVNWATNISPGATDEADQIPGLAFHFEFEDNDGLLQGTTNDEKIFVDAQTGDLTYTPVQGGIGTINVTIWLTDGGGTDNDGEDTSIEQNFSIVLVGMPLWYKEGENTILANIGDNVGIGTTRPDVALHIKNESPVIRLEDSTGDFLAWDIEFDNPSSLNFNYGNKAQPERMVTFTDRGTIKAIKFQNANFEVGSDGYLFVRELIVQANGDFIHPDYVFEPKYKPIPLKQLETYIKTNKHLPEIPSAKEVAKDGLKIGEMNTLLLKKVEELTLYIIEQNKRIEKLEKANKIDD